VTNTNKQSGKPSQTNKAASRVNCSSSNHDSHDVAFAIRIGSAYTQEQQCQLDQREG
jgi:hypothetical protein